MEQRTTWLKTDEAKLERAEDSFLLLMILRWPLRRDELRRMRWPDAHTALLLKELAHRGLTVPQVSSEEYRAIYGGVSRQLKVKT